LFRRKGQAFWQALQKWIALLQQRLTPLGSEGGALSQQSQWQGRRVMAPLDWVIPGKLAVGGLPQLGDRDRLQQANIQVILSLTAPIEADLPPEVARAFRCARVSLPDSRYEADLRVERLAKAVALVHRSLSQQLPIYVHCLAGVERSPLVCIAYLCCYHQLDLWEAVNWLKHVRPCAAPSMAQLQVVQDLVQQTRAVAAGTPHHTPVQSSSPQPQPAKQF